MKKTISAAMMTIALSAMFLTAEARNTRVLTGSTEASCTSATTVLDGAWTITTKADGTLLISDKNNNIVRMIADGGSTLIAEKGKDTPEVSTPISLLVDKCGNLHITDNTVLMASKQQPMVLPQDSNSWGDPDRQPVSQNNSTSPIVKR